jgi:hypothetical protein
VNVPVGVPGLPPDPFCVELPPPPHPIELSTNSPQRRTTVQRTFFLPSASRPRTKPGTSNQNAKSERPSRSEEDAAAVLIDICAVTGPFASDTELGEKLHFAPFGNPLQVSEAEPAAEDSGVRVRL